MVEATGLSLASSIFTKLQLRQVDFLTDNVVLVESSSTATKTPPYWRIKPFTQKFYNNKQHITASL